MSYTTLEFNNEGDISTTTIVINNDENVTPVATEQIENVTPVVPGQKVLHKCTHCDVYSSQKGILKRWGCGISYLIMGGVLQNLEFSRLCI